MPALLRLLPPKARCSVGIVSLQRIVEHIKASKPHVWIAEFQSKYGMN